MSASISTMMADRRLLQRLRAHLDWLVGELRSGLAHVQLARDDLRDKAGADSSLEQLDLTAVSGAGDVDLKSATLI